ncbi:MAG TPA: outer membrane beta-barrel protein [Cyclobacteriaceae bacterium]|nr:outer membrane beta-barrel protein [Cyclobacteriaceae bacterium]
MKKIFKLVVLFVVFGTATVQAQSFKAFRVGLGVGYASPAGEGTKAGLLIYLEPSYRLTDAIVVGLKAEGAVMARAARVTQNGQTTTAKGTVSAAGSYTLNGQYYLMNGGFRPFVGAGFGIYSLGSISGTASSDGTSSSSSGEVSTSSAKFGFYPRVGFDAGHFTMNVEYNIIGKSTNSYQVNSNGTITNATSESKNNYLGIRIGFFIGGGRK